MARKKPTIHGLQADLRAANHEIDGLMHAKRCLEEDLTRAVQIAARQPVPMLLACPTCGVRHIDRGDFATKPHHTHACQSCGMCWRPAVVPTVGVQFLPGFKDQ